MEDHAERVWGELVSGNFFSVLGVRPARGRLFLPSEYGDTPGAYPVAVISDRYWRAHYGADPAIAGKTIRINQHELTIVGVAAPAFHGSMPVTAFDVWVPYMEQSELNGVKPWMLRDRHDRNMLGIARIKQGVTFEQARAKLKALAEPHGRRQCGRERRHERHSAAAVEVAARAAGTSGGAAAHPDGCMRAGAADRVRQCRQPAAGPRDGAREGVQRAPSAGRRPCKAGTAGTGGEPDASCGRCGAGPGSDAVVESRTEISDAAGADATSGCHGHTAQFRGAGLYDRGLRICHRGGGTGSRIAGGANNLSARMNANGRSGSSGRRNRLRSTLVASEVALALVAMVGAGLFARGFQTSMRIDPGFDPDQVLLDQFYLSTNGYNLAQREEFCRRLAERMLSAPGVTDVAYSDGVPLGFEPSWWEELDSRGLCSAPQREHEYLPECHFTRIPALDAYSDSRGSKLY